jgi:hypothetical protein
MQKPMTISLTVFGHLQQSQGIDLVLELGLEKSQVETVDFYFQEFCLEVDENDRVDICRNLSK